MPLSLCTHCSGTGYCERDSCKCHPDRPRGSCKECSGQGMVTVGKK